MSRLPGISKSIEGQGKGKRAGTRFPVLEHAADRDLHVHTSIPHLQPSEHSSSSTLNSQKQRHSGKCDQAGKGGETSVSGGMESESRNLEMRFGWNKHTKSACLGLWLPGRGWITLVQYCEQHTALATSGGVWVLGKWVSSSAGFSGYPGGQSWLYFSKGNL